jgi:hypothetical protein
VFNLLRERTAAAERMNDVQGLRQVETSGDCSAYSTFSMLLPVALLKCRLRCSYSWRIQMRCVDTGRVHEIASEVSVIGLCL